MRVSCTWLGEWVSMRCDLRELTERLTLGGLEVGVVETAGPSLSKSDVLVGQIVDNTPHPNAQRLRVCTVDIGKRAPLTIVCGASNATRGEKVPVALSGAKLAGAVVHVKNIRGIESTGMICSAAELGLEEHSEGVMLLQRDAPLGMSVCEYLDFSDSVLEIEVTPNRGDCLSIAGVAREVSALTGAKLNQPPIQKIRARTTACLPIVLQAAEACPRYVGRAVRNIDLAAPVPDWMKERLRRSGVRSRNVVVDVTNYVMLELGQPMHAFDLDKLSGGIVVRKAEKHEKLQLLDGDVVTLNTEHLVIADHKKAVALAGIMGGKNSAIGDSTCHIYFESAFFPATAMFGKAREFGMRTDASHRFERCVDPTRQEYAMQRATQLLVSLAGGEPGPVTNACERKFIPRQRAINFDLAEIPRILGISVPKNRVNTLLKRLGMRVTVNQSGWKVTPPSWRSDIGAPHDLVEEVGRMVGFDNIVPRLPTATVSTVRHPENRIEIAQVKQKLVERGYFEAITYSFVDPQIQQILVGSRGIELRNPIADNMAVMRHSLWPGLLESVKKNCNRQRMRVRLFEEGKVFLQDQTQENYEEVHRLGGAATGSVLPRQWGNSPREVDFFDIKGDLLVLLRMSAAARIEFHPFQHPALHPGRSARVTLGKKDVGCLGQMHPSHQKRIGIDQPVYLFELDMAVLATAQLPHFSEISRYPAIRRDLAILVNAEVAAQDVLDAVRAVADGLLTDVELFDIYAGERVEKNHKSFAFGLTFQSNSSNLTTAEVDARTEKILKKLHDQFGAKLRI